jgi:rare lipoprotein A
MLKVVQTGIVCGFLIFLNACQTVNTRQNPNSKELQPGRYAILHDFAPTGPIPTFFKAVVPKDEPLSKYGNPPSYRVGGKTYVVQRSARGYKARGNASWYASKFHQQRTSSGEPYDMYALTAAHRTLPIPCYLRVTNLQNGRSVIVRVNDRGPFHSDRLIDLSYGAAVKLGIFPKGTAPVEIEAINPAWRSAPTRVTPTVGHFYLQAGAFQLQGSANQFRQRLSQWTRTQVLVNRVGRHFVVQIGPFASASESEQMKKVLARHGVHGAFSVRK